MLQLKPKVTHPVLTISKEKHFNVKDSICYTTEAMVISPNQCKVHEIETTYKDLENKI